MPRQVLITGVPGGMGGAPAESFTANGDMVIGIGRRRDKLTALRDRLGESLDSLQADLETVEGIDAAVDALGDRANAIDVLINNAGSMKFTPTHALNAHDVHSQLAINLLAPIWLTRKLLPGMIDRKSGLIVNMASAAGGRPSPEPCCLRGSQSGPHTFHPHSRGRICRRWNPVRRYSSWPGPYWISRQIYDGYDCEVRPIEARGAARRDRRFCPLYRL